MESRMDSSIGSSCETWFASEIGSLRVGSGDGMDARRAPFPHSAALDELEGELHRLLSLYDRLDGLRCTLPERQKLRTQMARVRHEMETTAAQPAH